MKLWLIPCGKDEGLRHHYVELSFVVLIKKVAEIAHLIGQNSEEWLILPVGVPNCADLVRRHDSSINLFTSHTASTTAVTPNAAAVTPTTTPTELPRASPLRAWLYASDAVSHDSHASPFQENLD